MMKSQTTKTRKARFHCFMCGKPKSKGTFIRHGFLCDQCELELVKADVADPAYDGYIARVKTLWPALALLMRPGRLVKPPE
jgi:uncharacterized protein (DUF983 family)